MYNLNDNYAGFTLKETREIPNMGTLYRFEHDRLGTPVLFLKTNDEVKAFNIGFRTPAKDDTGVTHIIEHSVLAGSKKYSEQDSFFDVCAHSVNDLANAYTANDHTMYHFITRNAKDFDNLFDFYVDSVFCPSFLTNKDIFLREGRHVENTGDGRLEISGVVYNEMKAHKVNPIAVEILEVFSTLFPNTPLQYEAGGDITCIQNCTWERCKKYYLHYYHPSNAVISFAGNFDVVTYLEHIDTEYLVNYKRRTYNFKNVKTDLNVPKFYQGVKPATKPAIFGVENPDMWLFMRDNDGLKLTDQLAIHLVMAYIGSYNEHKVRWNMITKQYCEELKYFIDTTSAGSCYGFLFEGATPEKIPEITKVFARYLTKVAEEGLQKKTLKIYLKLLRDYYVEDASKTDYILDTTVEVLQGYGIPSKTYAEVLDFLEDKMENDIAYFSEIIEKYMLQTTDYVVACFYPDAGYQKWVDNEIQKRINPKNRKVPYERQVKIQETSERLAGNLYDTKRESAANIPVLTRDDIKIGFDWNKSEVLKIRNKDVNVYELEESDRINLNLTFEISNLTVKETTIFRSMVDYLFCSHTKTRDNIDMSYDAAFLLKDYNTKIKYKEVDGKLHRYLYLNVAFDKNDYEAGVKLVGEVLTQVNYRKGSWNASILYWDLLDHFDAMKSSPMERASLISKTSFSKEAKFENDTTGLSACNYFSELLYEAEEKGGLERLCRKFEKIYKKVFVFDRMEAYIAVPSGAEKRLFVKSLEDAISEMPESVENPLDAEFCPVITSRRKSCDAAGIQSMVQYNALSIDVRDKMKDFEGSPEVVCAVLSERVIHKMVREFGNAYGGYVRYADGVFTFKSYRDPGVEETIDVFANAANILRSVGIKNLEGIKVAIAGQKSMFDCEMDKISAIESYKKAGKTPEDVVSDINKILDTTEEQVLECCKWLFDAARSGNISYYLVGNADKIKQSRPGLVTSIAIYQ
ncbi:MAG: insulinase family protein [Clostridia bacterium]|nr:insulinase family protein [Clostridia bacterium]